MNSNIIPSLIIYLLFIWNFLSFKISTLCRNRKQAKESLEVSPNDYFVG